MFFAFVTNSGAEFQSLVATPIKVIGVLLSLNFSKVALLVAVPFIRGWTIESLFLGVLGL